MKFLSSLMFSLVVMTFVYVALTATELKQKKDMTGDEAYRAAIVKTGRGIKHLFQDIMEDNQDD